MVSPASNSKVRAFGPGLENGVANLPSIFIIETNGGRCERIGIFSWNFRICRMLVWFFSNWYRINCLVGKVDIYVSFIDIAVSGRTLMSENSSGEPDIELVDNKDGTAVARFTVSFF